MSIGYKIIFSCLFVSMCSYVQGMYSYVEGMYSHGKIAQPTETVTTVMEFLETPVTYKQMSAALNETKLNILFQKFDLIGSRYTLFVPTDRAFDQFGRMGLLRPKDAVAPDPERQKKYEKFIKYHIVKNIITSKDLINLVRPLQTEAGVSLKAGDIGEILFSVELKGGIVHIIKKVLVNPELKDFLYPKSAS